MLRKRIYGTTRPGLLLKHQIPIKTDCWDVDRPGFMEVDLVSHSGDCAEGLFAHTLNLTDVFTGWVERRCVLGKGQTGVLQAIDDVRRQLPFPLLGIDSVGLDMVTRRTIWNRCAADLRPGGIDDGADSLVTEIGFDGLDAALTAIRAGQAKGRTVVRIGG